MFLRRWANEILGLRQTGARFQRSADRPGDRQPDARGHRIHSQSLRRLCGRGSAAPSRGCGAAAFARSPWHSRAAAEMLRGLLALGVGSRGTAEPIARLRARIPWPQRAPCAWARKNSAARIFCCWGKMATDGDTAQVGPMLAQLMGIPHIADVSRVVSLSERKSSWKN